MSTTPTFPISAELIFWDSEGFIFEVTGSHGDIYLVGFDYVDGWYCPCPDYHFRKHECKHIRECKLELTTKNMNVSDLLFCEVSA